MPFQIIRNDITNVSADAIVNTANPKPIIGSGTDSAIYKAAGEKKLLAARQAIGNIEPGKAVHTAAFKLKAKYIIHTAGPIWVDGKHGEKDILRSCYSNSLFLADNLKCKTVAFPLISSGAYGFPKDTALDAALSEIGKFLLTHDINITLGALPNTMRTMARASTFIRPLKYGLQTEKMRTICSDTQKMSWKRHYKPHQKNMARPQSNHRICSLAFFFSKCPTFALCRVIFLLG